VPLRVKKHPILEFNREKKLSFQFNDKTLYGWQDDSIAAALHANKIKIFSRSLKQNRPRGFFCGIGKCSSCLMQVNDVPNVRTCIAPLTQGVQVRTQEQFAQWPRKPSEKIPFAVKKNVDILVIGAGPAGLEAAFQAADLGASVLLVDENQILGGQLVKQTHKFFGSKQEKAGTRGIYIADLLKDQLTQKPFDENMSIMLDATVFGFYEKDDEKGFTFGVSKRKEYESQFFEVQCKAVIFAVGAMENMLLFPGNDLPGVYGAGAVQTLMNVYGVKPGNNVLMVGAGNVGLIVSYQLLQAGINVDRVVEAAPIIGGYHVHAAKLRRCGVPIYTRHSIKEVFGKDVVEGAVIVELDEDWQPVKGSEETIDCDTVCLAVGLTPSTRLLSQIGVYMETIPEAGGFIAIHNDRMQTTVPGVFVAGDSSGIEEASTAMIEGKIAGAAAVKSIGIKNKKIENRLQIFSDELSRLRAGPFGEKPRLAKEKINKLWRKYHEKI